MRNVLKGSFYNLVGLSFPIIVAFFCIPILLKNLGVEKFGILTLIWAFVSYFGLFDGGVSRALIRFYVKLKNENKIKELIELTSETLSFLFYFGVAFSILLFLIVILALKLTESQSVHTYSLLLFYVCISIPFILLTSGCRSILEAEDKFLILNFIRLPMGLYTFIAPTLATLYFSQDLEVIAIILTVGRIAFYYLHRFIVNKIIEIRRVRLFTFKKIKPLLVDGGWMALSNIVSPLMGFIDRYIIGLLISTAAVAYYVTPMEIVTKIWILPGAITAVLFPLFSSSNNITNSQKLYEYSLSIVIRLCLPVCLFIFLFSEEILSWWISVEFSVNSHWILAILAIGILINCSAHIPFTLAQSRGLSRSTALIHLVEFPFFVVALFIFTDNYGLQGTVYVWLARIVIDTALMFFIVTSINLKNIFIISLLLEVILISFFGALLKNNDNFYALFFLMFSYVAFTFVFLLKRFRVEE